MPFINGHKPGAGYHYPHRAPRRPLPYDPLPYGMKPGSAMGTRIQRMMQLDQVKAVLGVLPRLLAAAQRAQCDYQRLGSISRGLYEELELFSRGGPNVPITVKARDETNYVIGEAFRLMSAPPYADPYVTRFLQPFDPRCDAPSHCDAVLALRETCLGLERYGRWLTARLDTLSSRITQAEAIRGALEIAEPHHNGTVLRRSLEKKGGRAHPEWFRDFPSSLSDFDFAKLNKTDILVYFLSDL